MGQRWLLRLADTGPTGTAARQRADGAQAWRRHTSREQALDPAHDQIDKQFLREPPCEIGKPINEISQHRISFLSSAENCGAFLCGGELRRSYDRLTSENTKRVASGEHNGRIDPRKSGGIPSIFQKWLPGREAGHGRSIPETDPEQHVGSRLRPLQAEPVPRREPGSAEHPADTGLGFAPVKLWTQPVRGIQFGHSAGYSGGFPILKKPRESATLRPADLILCSAA